MATLRYRGVEGPCRYALSPWPEWRNGRRDGFKIRCSKGRVGSSPTSGTQAIRTLLPVGTRLVERRLHAASRRLSELRDELRVVDDQLSHLDAEAEELEVRALVSETPAATFEYRDAKAHADAMRKHRQHIVSSITELERRLDDLLDRMKVDSSEKSSSGKVWS